MREGREGLSSNVAEEAFCLKSAPGNGIAGAGLYARLISHFNITNMVI